MRRHLTETEDLGSSFLFIAVILCCCNGRFGVSACLNVGAVVIRLLYSPFYCREWLSIGKRRSSSVPWAQQEWQ